MNPNTICYWCKHFRSKRIKFKFTCDAYPEGIPEAFFPHPETSELFDHRFPFPGDNGFQFETIKEFAEYKKRHQFANYQSLESIQDALNIVYETLDQAHEKHALLPFADNEFTVPNPPQNTAILA